MWVQSPPSINEWIWGWDTKLLPQRCMPQPTKPLEDYKQENTLRTEMAGMPGLQQLWAGSVASTVCVPQIKAGTWEAPQALRPTSSTCSMTPKAGLGKHKAAGTRTKPQVPKCIQKPLYKLSKIRRKKEKSKSCTWKHVICCEHCPHAAVGPGPSWQLSTGANQATASHCCLSSAAGWALSWG